MSEMKKSESNCRGDMLTVVAFGTTPREKAELMSADATAARDWFEAHPGVTVRRRLASDRERLVIGLRPGATVVVRREPGKPQTAEFSGVPIGAGILSASEADARNN